MAAGADKDVVLVAREEMVAQLAMVEMVATAHQVSANRFMKSQQEFKLFKRVLRQMLNRT